MIIPVLCFGCGKVLGNKRKTFLEMTLKEKYNNEIPLKDEEPTDEFIDFSQEEVQKMAAGIAMDKLGLIRSCCRTTMMGTIDLLEDISY